MPRSKPYRIGRSRTGLGLFAAKPIAKGELIVEYTGRRIPTQQAHERERRTGCKFMFELNNRWTIDGSSRRNIARYVNHACRPNCYTDVVGRRIWIIAARPIATGEELTYDYNTDGVAGIRCLCRPGCRRVL
jgi:SET domain-containing protein